MARGHGHFLWFIGACSILLYVRAETITEEILPSGPTVVVVLTKDASEIEHRTTISTVREIRTSPPSSPSTSTKPEGESEEETSTGTTAPHSTSFSTGSSTAISTAPSSTFSVSTTISSNQSRGGVSLISGTLAGLIVIAATIAVIFLVRRRHDMPARFTPPHRLNDANRDYRSSFTDNGGVSPPPPHGRATDSDVCSSLPHRRAGTTATGSESTVLSDGSIVLKDLERGSESMGSDSMLGSEGEPARPVRPRARPSSSRTRVSSRRPPKVSRRATTSPTSSYPSTSVSGDVVDDGLHRYPPSSLRTSLTSDTYGERSSRHSEPIAGAPLVANLPPVADASYSLNSRSSPRASQYSRYHHPLSEAAKYASSTTTSSSHAGLSGAIWLDNSHLDLPPPAYDDLAPRSS